MQKFQEALISEDGLANYLFGLKPDTLLKTVVKNYFIDDAIEGLKFDPITGDAVEADEINFVQVGKNQYRMYHTEFNQPINVGDNLLNPLTTKDTTDFFSNTFTAEQIQEFYADNLAQQVVEGFELQRQQEIERQERIIERMRLETDPRYLEMQRLRGAK